MSAQDDLGTNSSHRDDSIPLSTLPSQSSNSDTSRVETASLDCPNRPLLYPAADLSAVADQRDARSLDVSGSTIATQSSSSAGPNPDVVTTRHNADAVGDRINLVVMSNSSPAVGFFGLNRGGSVRVCEVDLEDHLVRPAASPSTPTEQNKGYSFGSTEDFRDLPQSVLANAWDFLQAPYNRSREGASRSDEVSSLLRFPVYWAKHFEQSRNVKSFQKTVSGNRDTAHSIPLNVALGLSMALENQARKTRAAHMRYGERLSAAKTLIEDVGSVLDSISSFTSSRSRLERHRASRRKT